jgi:aarF domain-containing kinase
VVHLVNRDWRSLTELYRRMGFIPMDVDAAPIALALENALPDVLNAAVGELNFKNVVSKLGDVMYLFPFSLPPYYISIIRCLGVLEGLAIQVDKDFRIISDAYPYIASRLLTDPSAELQAALEQLLFKDGQPRWERLRSLLKEAATTSDYDVAAALDQLLAYLVSDRGRGVRELLVLEAVEVLDELGTDAAEFALAFASLSFSPRGAALRGPMGDQLRDLWQAGAPVPGGPLAGNATAVSAYLSTLADALVRVATPAAREANPSPALVEAAATLRTLASSGGGSATKVAAVVQKVLRDPVSQDVIARVASALGERAATRFVRRVFGVAGTGVGVGVGVGATAGPARKVR